MPACDRVTAPGQLSSRGEPIRCLVFGSGRASMATMVGDRQAAKNLPRRATFWFFATATSSLAGISINVVSNDAGYRWTAIG